MAIGSVVLTPGSAYTVPDALDLSADVISDGEWTPRVALAITAASGEFIPPLLLVLTGAAAAHAPHLGFAQRSARRAVGGYVLVDPVLPRPGSSSPHYSSCSPVPLPRTLRTWASRSARRGAPSEATSWSTPFCRVRER